MNSSKVSIFLLLCPFLLGLAFAKASAESPWRVGKAHAELVLPAAGNGAPISIDAYRGKKVLIVYLSPENEKGSELLSEWLKATEDNRKNEKLVVIAVLQDQYRDRAALFAQWKKLSIPILHDALDLGCVDRVPSVVALDERGIVRAINPKLSKFEAFEKRFLRKNFKKSNAAQRTPQIELPDPRVLKRRADEGRLTIIERDYADANFLGGTTAQLDEALRAYSKVLQEDAKDAFSFFRLGVAFRTRFDGPTADPTDAAKAIECWKNALKLQPKNAIFKARLAQFDPEAQKSGMSVDWVDQAREQIKTRGETPVSLAREPSADRGP